MLRPLTRRDAAWASAVFLLTLLCSYLAVRTRATYYVESQIMVVREQMENNKKMYLTQDATNAARIDELERTIYTLPPLAVPPTTTVVRRPSVFEQGQLNSLKELRERVTQLERWRYRMER